MIKLKVNTRDRDENNNPRILELTHFDEIDISLKYDSVMSTFRFKIYFNENNQEIAEILAPSHMHEVSIYYVHEKPGTYWDIVETIRGKRLTYEKKKVKNTYDELLITGFAVNTIFKETAKPEWVEIGGFSKCGILERADIPTSAMDLGLESSGVSFASIAQKIMRFFANKYRGGFDFKVESTIAYSKFPSVAVEQSVRSYYKEVLKLTEEQTEEEITKTTAPESGTVLAYLKKLAVQKGLVLSHNMFGDLVINVAYTGDEYLFEVGTGDGSLNYIEMSCGYNGDNMYSDIEVIRQPDKNGGNLSKAVVNVTTKPDKEVSLRNPLCRIVYIPKVITQTFGDDVSATQLARRELANTYKEVPLLVKLHKPTVNGTFIRPNNTIRAKSRSNYLYKPSKWFINEVNYIKSSKDEFCNVKCVLPGTYNNAPERQVDPFLEGKNHPHV